MSRRPFANGGPAFRNRGATLIELLVVIAIVGVLAGLIVPAVQKARDSAARAECLDHLRQIGLALHLYHDSAGRFPPGVNRTAAGVSFQFMSWQAFLLPYIEQGNLWAVTQTAYQSGSIFFHNPPHVGLATVIPVYTCRSDGRTRSPQVTPQLGPGTPVALSSYLGVEGSDLYQDGGILFLDSAIRLSDVTDGTSNTLMVGERPASPDNFRGWWYAGVGQKNTGSGNGVLGVREMNVVLPDACLPGPYHYAAGRFQNQCDLFHFWSPHAGGAQFVFADGSAHFLSYSADPIMPALATRAGGETVALP
jgi:prepilin-type N-terminal cleavage/methylation domain-containing protein/prepilin-type processing-associated H-X9-DG protein